MFLKEQFTYENSFTLQIIHELIYLTSCRSFLWHTKGEHLNTVPVTLFHAITMYSEWSFKKDTKCTI